MEAFKDIIKGIYPLSDRDINTLLSFTHKEFYPKDSYVLQEGSTKQEIYFVAKGLICDTFSHKDKKKSNDYILVFLREKEYISSNLNFIDDTPSEYNLLCLQDTVLYVMDKKALLSLSTKNIEIAQFILRMVNQLFMDAIQGIIRLKCYTPTERYKKLSFAPELFKNLSVSQTASFLGITIASLSRIRRKEIEKERNKTKS